MQDPPPPHEAALPHQQSKRIIQLLYPNGAGIHNFQDADNNIPAASPSNPNDRAIADDYHSVTDGALESRSAERRSEDALLKRGVSNPEDKDVEDYSGSSDTIGDGNKHNLRAQRDLSLGRNSSSTIEDVENEERGTTQTNHANQARDLEKGATELKNYNKFNQDGEDRRRAQWKNNIVGWNGPNDPQNPKNWKKSKKYTTTVLYSGMTLCITFASSVFSSATVVTAEKYGVSNEVMTLGTSLFVLVGAHFQHHSNPTLTKFTVSGFRLRPNNLGTPLGTLWATVSPLLRISRLRYLSNPRRCSPKHRNDHALSVPSRFVWVGTVGHNRRNTGRFLGSCRKRFCPWPFLRRYVHWTCGRTYHW